MCVWGGGGGCGLSLTFASQQGGMGHVLIVPIKSLKKTSRSLGVLNQTVIRPINFSVCKSYFVLVVLLCTTFIIYRY